MKEERHVIWSNYGLDYPAPLNGERKNRCRAGSFVRAIYIFTLAAVLKYISRPPFSMPL